MYFDKTPNSDYSNHILNDTSDSFGVNQGGDLYYDNFLGIGKRNKQKKAEKKIKKAEKQLSKGHVKAAERKLKKGTAILNKVQASQGKILGAANQINDINQTKQVIDATLTGATESPYTSPGQIGSESGATTMNSAQAAQQSMGGGGGDISASDSTSDLASTEGGETSTPANPKELGGVTVSSGKMNWIVIGVIAAVAVFVLIFILKKGKKK